MPENVLRLEHITMQFGGVVAVNDFSMEVNKGEIVALIGPNGAGKTTAFNCITGVYEPTNGAVYLNDELIVSNYPQGKMKTQYQGENAGMFTKVVSYTPDKITAKGIARTFQNIRLFANLSVFENILIAQHLHVKSNMLASTFFSGFAFWDKKEKQPLARREEMQMRKRADELLEEFGLT
ncbi:MAG: ATP-binding cassette domain-containing protein, partial [Firmicutes bacterium]|nr:ATP-binding cassette domain-containing protein [Bacillota bacterium]